MATFDYPLRPLDDDAISVASDCTLPDAAAVGFGAPLERMTLEDACGYSSKSYASSQYPSCDYLPSGGCADPDCDCSSDEEDVPVHRHDLIFDDEDEHSPLSPCASSSSSLSDYLRPRRRSSAGDLAGVEHCDTPKVAQKFSTSFAAALSQGDAPPPRPGSPLEHIAVHNQQRIGTSESHRHQLALARFLNAEPVRSDPWNHTIPVIHIREHTIANRSAGATLVTERLHDWWSVPFATVQDCLDFARQVLEGVAFLHENQITNLAEAVRPHNIQMDTGLAPIAPPVLPARRSGKASSAPVTPAGESDDLPSVAWTRSEFPVRYYFTATSGMHRVRRLGKEVCVAEDDEDEAETALRELDTVSRAVDDDAWETSTAVDLVAVGHALGLVFGRMPFSHLRPIIQELCDAFESGVSANDVLSHVESLESGLTSLELLQPVGAA